MKTNKTWTLPKPDFVDGEYVWKPVVRLGSHVPFGYRQDPNDGDILLPIPEELELFEQAKTVHPPRVELLIKKGFLIYYFCFCN